MIPVIRQLLDNIERLGRELKNNNQADQRPRQAPDREMSRKKCPGLSDEITAVSPAMRLVLVVLGSKAVRIRILRQALASDFHIISTQTTQRVVHTIDPRKVNRPRYRMVHL